MGARAIAWLVRQYQCVFSRMRSREFAAREPFGVTRRHARPAPEVGFLPFNVERLEDRMLLSVGTVTGTAAAENFKVRLNGGTVEVLKNNALANTFTLAGLTQLTIDAGAGNDSITIDTSNGNPTPTDGIRLIGGRGNDTITGAGGVDFIDETADAALADADVTVTNSSLTFAHAPANETDTISGIDKVLVLGRSLDSTAFAGQALLLNAAPAWVEQGPGPIGGAAGIRLTDPASPNPISVATGAVQAIAVDPVHNNNIYVGGVNGGIWKSSDTGATWDPIGDQLPSLAISTITIDPANPAVVYAGTGSKSSFRRDGGGAVGIYKSTDAGNSWSLIGGSELAGQIITGIVVNGSVVLASTDGMDGGAALPASASGIYRSVAGGPFAPLKPTATAPFGAVSALAAIQDGATTHVYAGVNGKGIYLSDDVMNGAADHWSLVNGNLEALKANVVTNSVRVRLATTPADPHVVYGAFVAATPVGSEIKDRVAGVFRSANNGTTWTSLGTPGDPGADTDPAKGIHPGGQADIHFSLVADPANANVVFAGGDASGLNARIYRSDGTGWTAVTHAGAHDTYPHVDSRIMAFVGADILEGDDGGLYRLIDPANAASDRHWVSAMGDPALGSLHLTELMSVGYDPNNNTIIAGAQDNDVILQRAGTKTWRPVSTGDGEIVGVAVKGADTYTYSSTQHLGDFKRVKNGDVAGAVSYQLEVNGTGILDDTQLVDFDDTRPFVTQFAINAVDPDRFMIGTHFIYESNDGFDLFQAITSENVTTDLDMVYGSPVGWFPGTRKPPKGTPYDIGEVKAIAYGGYTLNAGVRTGDAGVAYVAGDKGDIYVRRGAGRDFEKTDWADAVGGVPVDLVLHPDDWKELFVLTADGKAWYGKLGAANPDAPQDKLTYEWHSLSNLSGSLPSKTRTIEVYQENKGADPADPADDSIVVLVGGGGGVFATTLHLAAPPASGSATWHELGSGLPNVLVTDLHYDSTDDLLVVGTLGRGAWTLPHASLALKQGGSALAVDGRNDAVAGDTIRLVRDATNPALLDVFLSAPDGTLPATPSLQVQLSLLSRIELNGRAGDDTFQIDRSNGVVAVSDGIHIEGGDGNDALVLQGKNSIYQGSAYPVSNNINHWIVDGSGALEAKQTVHILLSSTHSPNAEVASADVGMKRGLRDLLGSAGGMLDASLSGQSVSAVDAGSLAAGLNGWLGHARDPEDDATAGAAEDAPGLDESVSGNSFIKRFFEEGAGAFNLESVIAAGPAALRDALQALDPAGTVTMSPAGATDFSNVTFSINLSKQLDASVNLAVLGRALVSAIGASNVGDALKNIQFSGDADITAKVHLNLTFGVNATDGFFIQPTAAPEFTISDIQVKGDAKAVGHFGFLGVKVEDPVIAMKSGVELQFDLGDGSTKITVQDLLNPAGLLSFKMHSPGTAGPDVTFTANVNVDAEFAGLNLPIAETPVTLTWDNVDSAGGVGDVFKLAAAGGGAASLLSFLKLDPAVLLAKLNDLKGYIDTIADSVNLNIPFLNTNFSDLLNVTDSFESSVTRYLHLGGGGVSFLTAQDLATNLAASLTHIHALNEVIDAATDSAAFAKAQSQNILRTISDLGFTFNADGELTYAVDAKKFFQLHKNISLDVSLANGFAGVNFSAAADFQVGAELSFTLGIDLRDISITSADSILDNVFIKDAKLQANVDFSLSGVNGSANLGFLGVQIQNGSANANFTVGVALADPKTHLDDGRVDLSEIIHAIGSPSSLLGPTSSSGSATFTLPLAAPFLGASFATAGPDTTVVATVDLSTLPPHVSLALPTTGRIADLLSFKDMSFSDVLGMLNKVLDYLGKLEQFDFLKTKLPLINRSVSDVLSAASKFAAKVNDLQANPAGSLQQVEAKIRDSFGITDPALVQLAYVNHALKLKLNFGTGFDQLLNFDFDVASLPGLPAELASVFNLTGSGSVRVQGGAQFGFDIGLDLTNPASPAPFLFTDTAMSMSLGISTPTPLDFTISIFGLSAAINDATVSLHKKGNTTQNASFGISLVDSDTDGRVYFSDLATLSTSNVSLSLDGAVDLNFPFEFPPGTALTPPLNISIPDLAALFAGQPNAVVVNSYPSLNDLLNGVDLSGDLTALLNSLNQLLALLQAGLNNGAFAKKIPLIGDKLKDGANVIDRFRTDLLAKLQPFISDPSPKTITAVKQALFDALGPAGLDILQDGPDADAVPSLSDVNLFIDDITHPHDVRFNFHIGKAAQVVSVPLGFDIGLPALGLSVDGAVQVSAGMDLNIGFGYSTDAGVGPYLYVGSPDELKVDVGVHVPGFHATGKLGFLRVDVDDDAAAPSSFGARFGFNLTSPDDRLTLAELTGAKFDASLDAQAKADVNLKLVVSYDAAANFPRIFSDLNLDWSFGNASTGATAFGSAPQVAFNNIKLDLGSFLANFAKPILDAVHTALGPVQPIIDFLNLEVPMLAKVSAVRDFFDQNHDKHITISEVIHTLDPNAVLSFVDGVSALEDLLNAIPTNVGSNVTIDLGHFDLGGIGDLRNLSTLAGSTLAHSTEANTAAQLAAKAPGFATALNDGRLGGSANAGGGKLEFPIIQHPKEVFNLLMGKDPDLFLWDMPRFEANLSIEQTFPILGPISIKFGGSVGIAADLTFGYDTKGLRELANGGPASSVFDGFFLLDIPSGSTTDPAEITATGEIHISASVDAVVVSGDITGSILGTLELNLNDPDNSDGTGKVRFSDLQHNLAKGLLCVFDISGELSAVLSGHVKVGVWKFAKKFSAEFAKIQLLDFTHTCDSDASGAQPDPVLATDLGNGVLQLNMGPHSGERLYGDLSDDGEHFDVHADPDDPTGVIVSAFGYSQKYAGVSKIVAEGGNGDDIVVIDTGLNVTSEMWGDFSNSSIAAGNDQLTGGEGSATLHGGGGDDALVGRSGADHLFGEAGKDALYGNEGNDELDGGDDNDLLDAGAGNDTARGGAGDDTVMGAAGSDLLYGDDGNDDIDGDNEVDAAAPPTPSDDTIYGGAGNDTLRGGIGNDSISGDAGPDSIAGGDGNDLLHGGDDNDEMYGDAGNDLVAGDAGDDYLEGNAGNDTVSGGDGNDKIIGDSSESGPAGNDSLDGGAGNDLLAGDNAALNPAVSLIGGAGGNDAMNGGDGDDTLYGQAGNDTLHGNAGADSMSGGDGDDVMSGDTGNDAMTGDAGADLMHGNDDADAMSGGDGDDVMFGDAGNDSMHGNNNDDQITGGAGADSITGDAGFDVILGDDGTITTVPAALNPNGSKKKTVVLNSPLAGDADVLSGGADDDSIFGGAGNDSISGDAGDDYLEGNAGNDSLSGGDNDDDMIGGSSDAAVPSPADRADGADAMDGGAGHDVIVGDNGAITRRVGTGNVLLRYKPGTTPGTGVGAENNAPIRDVTLLELDAVGGNDVMSGGAGDDSMFGGLGDDSMYGNDGNDDMIGHLGADLMDGGAGSDGIVGDKGTIVTDLLDGSGTAIIQANGQKIDATINAAGTLKRFVTLVDPTLGGADRISGGTGDDFIHGGAGNDLLAGDDGNDILFGDLGNDALRGGLGNDHLWGGSGDDDLDGGAGTDIAYGGDGQDRLVADVKDDRLIDWFGNFNQFIVPGPGQGAPTIIRSPNPAVRDFLLQLAAADGATSADAEAAIVAPPSPPNSGPGI